MEQARILIVGANGQLGNALRSKYPGALTVSSSDFDITDPKQLEVFDWSRVSVIMNAAAYTNVDGAETAEGRLVAWQVNAAGAANLAKIATAHNLTLVHFSTDYVFDGSKKLHFENELFSPLGVYGQSKAAGDLAISCTPNYYILRTTWLIGEGRNFVRIMLDLAKRGISPSVVNDQIGRLTFTDELVSIVDHLLINDAPYGTYNATNTGEPASWADISRIIFDKAELNTDVTGVTTKDYFKEKPEAAPRPLNSIMDLTKLTETGFTGNDWRDSLTVYIQEELQR